MPFDEADGMRSHFLPLPFGFPCCFFFFPHPSTKGGRKLYFKDEECRTVVGKRVENEESECTHQRKFKKKCFTTEIQTMRKVRGRGGRKAEEGSAKCAKGAEEACKKREGKSCLTGSPLLLHLTASASALIQSTGHGAEYQTVTHSRPHTHSFAITQHNNMPLSVLFTRMH